MSTSARSPARRTALICVVLLALVLAQSLGLLHRLAHAGHAPQAFDMLQADAHAADGLKGLFGGHEADSRACDLYDQLTHADVLWSVPALVLPVLRPAAPAERHAAWHFAAQATGFLARGPPALA